MTAEANNAYNAQENGKKKYGKSRDMLVIGRFPSGHRRSIYNQRGELVPGKDYSLGETPFSDVRPERKRLKFKRMSTCFVRGNTREEDIRRE